RPSACIIGEPSGWDRITLGYKGSAWFEVEVARTLAHTSAQAESACEAAVDFWNAVTAWAAQHNAGTEKMFEQVIPTLRAMNSDSDGFTERAQLKFGVRLPAGVSVGDVEEAMRALGPGAEVRLLEGVAAHRAEKNTPLVRAMLAALRGSGASPSFTVKSGTSDMNIVAPAWGCPILAYGPGDSALDHTPEEHISLAEFERAVAVLARALADPRLCGAG
ncbi:MAG: M20/M25/M40 family metallo-hydrolase, partial [Chloroflexi bacterium]|nr:M20/M25/M40 family metallo-hydrolase [Chloroflexota bacterium]